MVIWLIEKRNEPITLSNSNTWSKSIFSYHQFEEKFLSDKLGITEVAVDRVEHRLKNRVYLDYSERDEYGIPMIQVDYSHSVRDHELINKMLNGII